MLFQIVLSHILFTFRIKYVVPQGHSVKTWSFGATVHRRNYDPIYKPVIKEPSGRGYWIAALVHQALEFGLFRPLINAAKIEQYLHKPRCLCPAQLVVCLSFTNPAFPESSANLDTLATIVSICVSEVNWWFKRNKKPTQTKPDILLFPKYTLLIIKLIGCFITGLYCMREK